jgi:hypothetical protein
MPEGGTERLENGDVVTVDTEFEVVEEWSEDETTDGKNIVELFHEGVYLRVLRADIRSVKPGKERDSDE